MSSIFDIQAPVPESAPEPRSEAPRSILPTGPADAAPAVVPLPLARLWGRPAPAERPGDASEPEAEPESQSERPPRIDKLARMGEIQLEALEVEVPAGQFVVQPNQLDRLAALQVSPEPTVTPAPAGPDQLHRLTQVELPPAPEPPPVERPKTWDFDFERNPNGTIRRIRARQVIDDGENE